MRVKEYKHKNNNNNKKRDPYISPPCEGATADTNFTKLGRIAETRDVVTGAKVQINWYTIVALAKGWSFMF